MQTAAVSDELLEVSASTPASLTYALSDEEILGAPEAPSSSAKGASEDDAAQETASAEKTASAVQKPDATAEQPAEPAQEERAVPGEYQETFAAHPALKDIFFREQAFREVFPTLAEAKALRERFPTIEDATAAIQARQDLGRVDELFESGDPRSHAELISWLQQRDPQAFRTLAATFGQQLASLDQQTYHQIAAGMVSASLANQRLPEHLDWLVQAAEKQDLGAVKFLASQLAAQLNGWRQAGPTGNGARQTQLSPAEAELARREQAITARETQAAQQTFGWLLERVNSDVERGVQQSVEGKVAELLPDAPAGARQKIATEIYRELDAVLKKDHGLLQQVKSALRGSLALQGAAGKGGGEVASALIGSRAKALLPGVAKRIVGDWTTTVLSANQARRSKQAASASRADIGMGGSPGTVMVRQRGVDYARMSDEEILSSE